MIFYINNSRRPSYCENDKEIFLKDLSELIEEVEKEGGTYFDISFETNLKEENDD